MSTYGILYSSASITPASAAMSITMMSGGDCLMLGLSDLNIGITDGSSTSLNEVRMPRKAVDSCDMTRKRCFSSFGGTADGPDDTTVMPVLTIFRPSSGIANDTRCPRPISSDAM